MALYIERIDALLIKMCMAQNKRSNLIRPSCKEVLEELDCLINDLEKIEISQEFITYVNSECMWSHDLVEFIKQLKIL